MAARLIVTAGANRGAQFPLADRIIFNIGSDRSSTVCLEDPKISPNHCRLYKEDSKFTLFDVSGKGLLVNGKKVVKAILQEGDVITLGDSELRFAAGDDAAHAPHGGGAAPGYAPPPPAYGAPPQAAYAGAPGGPPGGGGGYGGAPRGDDFRMNLEPAGTQGGPPPGSITRVWLQCVEGNDKGKTFDLSEGNVWVIGRGHSADITVMDIKVSRAHCRIDRVGHVFYLNDLNSTNGSFLNGQQIDRQVLHRGDYVKIGYTILSFHFETAEEPTPARAPSFGGAPGHGHAPPEPAYAQAGAPPGYGAPGGYGAPAAPPPPAYGASPHAPAAPPPAYGPGVRGTEATRAPFAVPSGVAGGWGAPPPGPPPVAEDMPSEVSLKAEEALSYAEADVDEESTALRSWEARRNAAFPQGGPGAPPPAPPPAHAAPPPAYAAPPPPAYAAPAPPAYAAPAPAASRHGDTGPPAPAGRDDFADLVEDDLDLDLAALDDEESKLHLRPGPPGAGASRSPHAPPPAPAAAHRPGPAPAPPPAAAAYGAPPPVAQPAGDGKKMRTVDMIVPELFGEDEGEDIFGQARASAGGPPLAAGPGGRPSGPGPGRGGQGHAAPPAMGEYGAPPPVPAPPPRSGAQGYAPPPAAAPQPRGGYGAYAAPAPPPPAYGGYGAPPAPFEPAGGDAGQVESLIEGIDLDDEGIGFDLEEGGGGGSGGGAVGRGAAASGYGAAGAQAAGRRDGGGAGAMAERPAEFRTGELPLSPYLVKGGPAPPPIASDTHPPLHCFLCHAPFSAEDVRQGRLKLIKERYYCLGCIQGV